MPSYKEFLESLPKKRMAAGCLFFNEQGQILLVKLTYKPAWGIPGGVVELNESPRQACRREIQEELGLERNIGDLLVVDYNSPTAERTESLQFIFVGGILNTAEIKAIQLQQDEISEFRFFNTEHLPFEMGTPLRRRILASWQQISIGKSIYLEDQE